MSHRARPISSAAPSGSPRSFEFVSQPVRRTDAHPEALLISGFSLIAQPPQAAQNRSIDRHCKVTAEQRVWFLLSKQYSCLVFKSEKKIFDGSLTVRAGNSPGEAALEIGAIFPVARESSEDKQARPGVVLRLTPGQKVFDPLQTDGTGFITGAALWDYGVESAYVQRNVSSPVERSAISGSRRARFTCLESRMAAFAG
jgi:hypothetical protein